MILVSGTISADNSNVLAGSDLQSAPGPGILEFYCASTQSDTVISISAPPTIVARAIKPMLRSSGTPSLVDDSPLSLELAGGEMIILNVDIVTAAVFGYIARFYSADEL